MKSIKMFGKSVPLLAIVVISLLAVGAGAVLLTSYGVVSLTGDITQSVTIDPKIDDMAGVHGGETICVPHTITNAANVDVTAKLVVDTHDGITVAFMNTLVLENKDSNWDVIGADGIKATVKYTVVSETFSFELEAEGLEDVQYSLIYYQDKGNRFVDWGGEPGALLGTWMAVDGKISGIGSPGLIDIPVAGDWNDNPVPDYTDNNNGFDDYDHASGAKIWLVPSDCVTGSIEVTTWTPARFLFETDLIRYFDSTDTITIPNNEVLMFDFCYTFPANYAGGTLVTVDVQPAP